MTTTLTRSIAVELADSTDIQTVLRQNYKAWNAGLTYDQYVQFLRVQLSQPWSRRNYRYFVARKEKTGPIVSSCKLYTFEFQSRNRVYKVAGIGGVFTAEEARGRGYASDMLEQIVKRAKSENFDAMLLFSDIDPMFYERLGFELLPDNNFHIWTNEPEFERWVMSGPGFVEDLQAHAPDLSAVSLENAEQMVSHYRRYLVRQPYGLLRDLPYWQYKLKRSLYRADYVADHPPLELLTMDEDTPRGGYAIFEHSGKVLRVLEVIGGEESTEILWRHILRTALLRRVHLVRGWEGTAPAFRRHVRWIERTEWARPMLLPINPETAHWADLDSCPLLELDHF